MRRRYDVACRVGSTLPWMDFSHFSHFLLVRYLVRTFLFFLIFFFLFSFFGVHKKHKNPNKRISYFFPLRCFSSAFFIFVRLFAFCTFAWLRFCAFWCFLGFLVLFGVFGAFGAFWCFWCVRNLFVKKIKVYNCPNNLIYISTLAKINFRENQSR